MFCGTCFKGRAVQRTDWDALCISYSTVERHLENMCERLDERSRAGVVAQFLKATPD